MKIFPLILLLLVLSYNLNANEVKIKHVSIEDQVALKIAADKVAQAQKEFDKLKTAAMDKYVYPPDSNKIVWFGSAALVRITSGTGEPPQMEWKLTDDYSAFVYTQKDSTLKPTCIIGVNTQ